MAVRYKFFSATDYGAVKFDGGWITVADLKLAISAQKKLDRDMDLLVTNATTGKGPFGCQPTPMPKPKPHTCARCLFAWIVAEYTDERILLNNTSVTIKRVPAATVIQMRYVLSEQQRKRAATDVRAPLKATM